MRLRGLCSWKDLQSGTVKVNSFLFIRNLRKNCIPHFKYPARKIAILFFDFFHFTILFFSITTYVYVNIVEYYDMIKLIFKKEKDREWII